MEKKINFKLLQNTFFDILFYFLTILFSKGHFIRSVISAALFEFEFVKVKMIFWATKIVELKFFPVSKYAINFFFKVQLLRIEED